MKIKVGQIATRSITVGSEEVEKYAQITGDYNPLHFDEKFASATPFKKLVAQGVSQRGYLMRL